MQGFNHVSALDWTGLLSFFSLISIVGDHKYKCFTFVLLYTGMRDEKIKTYTIYFRREQSQRMLVESKVELEHK